MSQFAYDMADLPPFATDTDLDARNAAAARFSAGLPKLGADFTTERAMALVPGFAAREYSFVVWMARLCNNPATRGKYCIPEEIVARLAGLNYETKQNRIDFKDRHLVGKGVEFETKKFGETSEWVSGQQQSIACGAFDLFSGPEGWTEAGVKFGFSDKSDKRGKWRFLTPEATQVLLVQANNERGRAFARIYLALGNAAVALSDAVGTGQAAVVATTTPVIVDDYALVRDLVVTTSRRMNASEKRKHDMAAQIVNTKYLKVLHETNEQKEYIDVAAAERKTTATARDKAFSEHKVAMAREMDDLARGADERRAVIAREADERQLEIIRLQVDASAAADARQERLMNLERQNAGTIAASFRKQGRSNNPSSRFSGRR